MVHEERYEIHNALENRGGKIGSGRSRKYFTNIFDVNKRNASIRSNQWQKCMGWEYISICYFNPFRPGNGFGNGFMFRVIKL